MISIGILLTSKYKNENLKYNLGTVADMPEMTIQRKCPEGKIIIPRKYGKLPVTLVKIKIVAFGPRLILCEIQCASFDLFTLIYIAVCQFIKIFE